MFFHSPKSTAPGANRATILAQTQIHDQRLSVQLTQAVMRRNSIGVSRSVSNVSVHSARSQQNSTKYRFDSNDALTPIDGDVASPGGCPEMVETRGGTIQRSGSLRRSLLRPQITISHDSVENLQCVVAVAPDTSQKSRNSSIDPTDRRLGYVYDSYDNYPFAEKMENKKSSITNNETTSAGHSHNNSMYHWSDFAASPPPLWSPSMMAIGRRRGSKNGPIRWPPTTTSITATLQQQRGTGRTTTVVLRQPTITIQEDGLVLIDHLAARWNGLPGCGGNSALLSDDSGDDGTTDSETSKRNFKQRNCLKRYATQCLGKTCKYVKILTPHVILVSVLIGYLCFGAWILMLLETRTELMARSRKLIRLSNLMINFTAESWKLINDTKNDLTQREWTQTFREYMMRISETVDDRRPIRRELNAPDQLDNLHNKWTFPTALLYVLTVLTTCGYGEVSVDTDTGKIFSVVFALVGIPLMFITAADIGKFLSETLLRLVKNWNLFVQYVKKFLMELFCKHKKFEKRKSLQSAAEHQFETLGLLGASLEGTGTEENLWFPIGAYVSCICLYCSMGSAMFIHWERTWSFIHAFHFGFNLIVTVGLGDVVVTDYLFLSLIVAFVIVGLSVVTMCVDLASTHLKAYFTRIHYFGRARRFLELSDDLREIVALLGAMRKKKHGKVMWNDLRDFLDNELCDRPFEPHELLMKLRFIDETTNSAMSTIRHNSSQSDLFRDAEYLWRLNAP